MYGNKCYLKCMILKWSWQVGYFLLGYCSVFPETFIAHNLIFQGSLSNLWNLIYWKLELRGPMAPFVLAPAGPLPFFFLFFFTFFFTFFTILTFLTFFISFIFFTFLLFLLFFLLFYFFFKLFFTFFYFLPHVLPHILPQILPQISPQTTTSIALHPPWHFLYLRKTQANVLRGHSPPQKSLCKKNLCKRQSLSRSRSRRSSNNLVLGFW